MQAPAHRWEPPPRTRNDLSTLDPASTAEGLDDLIDLVLSRCIFDPYDPGGGQLTEVITALRYYGVTPVTTEDGQFLPAPLEAGVLGDSYPGHKRIRRTRGVTFEEEQAEWARLKREMHPRRAVMPRDVLDGYLPTELRRVVGAIILDGPYVFADRATRALETYAATPIAPKVSRPEGGFPMQTTIGSKIKHLQRFVTPLTDSQRLRLGVDHPAHDHLKRWREEATKAPRIVVEATENVPSVALGPPPLLQARRLLTALNQEIYGRLGITREEDVIPTIEALSDSRAIHIGLHTVLRNRAVYVLCAAVGQRIDAALRTKRGDLDIVVPEADAPAAVRHTPGKTRQGRTPRNKPLPQELWLMLAASRAYTDRVRAAKGLPALSSSAPLFLGEVSINSQCSSSTIYRWLAGNSGREKVKAALPVATDDGDEDGPARPVNGESHGNGYGRGYSAHPLRKLARRLVSSDAAHEWAAERGIPWSELEVMGETLLDHELKDLANLYKGFSTTAAMERNSARAIQLTWALLSGDLGFRKVTDVEAYRHALVRHRTATEQRDLLKAELHAMLEDAGRTGHEVSPTAVHRNILQAEELAEVAHSAAQIIEQAERGGLLIAVPDEVDKLTPFDPVQVRRETLGGHIPNEAKPRVRNWITPEELAVVLAVGASTVRSWLANGLPRNKLIWTAGAIQEFSTRRRAIRADAICDEAIDTPEKAALLADLLANDPPAGWTTFPRFVAEDLVAA